MAKSNMTQQIENYIHDRALFSADIQAKALKWQTNYTHPLAAAYSGAKNRLESVIAAAKRRARERQLAIKHLRARMDFAVGLLFGLMGPFVDKAVGGLKTSMLITETDVDTRVLTKWYSDSHRQTDSFQSLLDREHIR